MSSKVDVSLAIYAEKQVLVDSINRALGPDNLNPPADMEISSTVRSIGDNTHVYVISLKIQGDIAHAIKRARSTINEVLSIIKAINEVYKVVEKQDRFLRH